jgi:hypothetical protein
MVTETNISQFKSWLSSAPPDDLLTIAPVLFSRIGNFDQTHKQRFIEEIQRSPQAMSVFEALPVLNQ